MQFFEKPDLLLRKGKRNRFRMGRTIDALGIGGLRLVTPPSLNQLEKLFNRGIVEDAGETDANVKLFFDQPSDGRRGKRMEPNFEKALVEPQRTCSHHLAAKRTQPVFGARSGKKRCRLAFRHRGTREQMPTIQLTIRVQLPFLLLAWRISPQRTQGTQR